VYYVNIRKSHYFIRGYAGTLPEDFDYKKELEEAKN